MNRELRAAGRYVSLSIPGKESYLSSTVDGMGLGSLISISLAGMAADRYMGEVGGDSSWAPLCSWDSGQAGGQSQVSLDLSYLPGTGWSGPSAPPPLGKERSSENAPQERCLTYL